jgi:3',5'-cyclic-AMP phosphodiesterase
VNGCILGVWALTAALCCTACLAPAAERAERDTLIGQADGKTVSISVTDGLAAVRELDDAHIVLWQSAPAIELSLTWQRPASIELQVHNTMPSATLRAEGKSDLQLEALDAEPVTQRRFRLDKPSAGTVRLRLEPNELQTRPFDFALLSDVQEAIDRVSDIYVRLNQEPSVEFLLGAGDLTQRGTVSQLERFERELLTANVPYYTTLGNHELGTLPVPFQERFGRGSFSFLYRGARFTLLDSASATIDPRVYTWLDDWLELGQSGLHFVAMHIPPVDPMGVRNGSFASRMEAHKLLGRLRRGGVDLTLYGHVHSYYRFSNAGIPARISGGGGALPERFDRMGRHFLVIHTDPERETFETRVVRVD